MNIHKLHAIYLFVEDVRESSSWYSNVLNIPLSIDEDYFGLIKIGDSELCFHQSDNKSPISLGGSVGYWLVDDLKQAADLFIEKGGILYRGPIQIPDTKDGICQIKDLFGNVVGLQGKYLC